MANKRAFKGCVEIRICVSDELDKDITRFQNMEVFKTGKKPYRKNEAAADYFEKLNAIAGYKILKLEPEKIT